MELDFSMWLARSLTGRMEIKKEQSASHLGWKMLQIYDLLILILLAKTRKNFSRSCSRSKKEKKSSSWKVTNGGAFVLVVKLSSFPLSPLSIEKWLAMFSRFSIEKWESSKHFFLKLQNLLGFENTFLVGIEKQFFNQTQRKLLLGGEEWVGWAAEKEQNRNGGEGGEIVLQFFASSLSCNILHFEGGWGFCLTVSGRDDAVNGCWGYHIYGKVHPEIIKF